MQITTAKSFSVTHTNITKGIACILLLAHHLFSNSSAGFTPLLTIGGVPVESLLAAMCKVCVCTFLILSGYGVNETLNKAVSLGRHSTQSLFRSSLRLLWKLWANYIVVFLLFVPWQGLIGRSPYPSVLDMLADILGISYFTNAYTMNATWWFMSVAIAAYLIAPLFKLVMTRRATALLAVLPMMFMLYLFFGSVFWCYAFMLGMVASEYGLFDILRNKMVRYNQLYIWIVCGTLVLVSGVLRYSSPGWGDFPLAISIVIFSYLCVSKVRFLAVPLEFIGKHSANIFFFHSFFLPVPFRTFVFAPKYAPLILLVFTVACLVISMLIEYLKKITGIQKLVRFVGKKIEGRA